MATKTNIEDCARIGTNHTRHYHAPLYTNPPHLLQCYTCSRRPSLSIYIKYTYVHKTHEDSHIRALSTLQNSSLSAQGAQRPRPTYTAGAPPLAVLSRLAGGRALVDDDSSSLVDDSSSLSES
jgi:hypothetical protein